MKIGIIDGEVHIREASNEQYLVIKSWSLMRWDKKNKELVGYASMELLDKLAGIVKLPESIEQRRKSDHRIADAVNEQRLAKNPEPLTEPPVKATLFKHQIGALNAALLTFRLIEPRPGSQ